MASVYDDDDDDDDDELFNKITSSSDAQDP